MTAVRPDTAERMRTRLAELAPESIDILDESQKHAGHAGARDGGGHYELVIVSPRFSGATRQARHRMIYAALAPMMGREIHALSIRAFAPNEL